MVRVRKMAGESSHADLLPSPAKKREMKQKYLEVLEKVSVDMKALAKLEI